MYALVDCDHFFASCERVFRPDLATRPVAVLSNQDGCVIARSPEVKALGIKMGEPFFMCKTQLQKANTAVFSANFQLYADLSARLMTVLKSMSSKVEVYSIDEAFIDLSHLSSTTLLSFAKHLKARLWKEIGIPVSIGIATNMTLAKLATRFAKQHHEGIWMIQEVWEREQALRQTPLHEIWGIGTRWAQALIRQGLNHAWDLTCASTQQISILNRCGRQSIDELKGHRRFTLQTLPPPRKSIRVSRTFGEQVFDEIALCEAMSHFASKLGARLRRHQLTTASLLIWLEATQAHIKTSALRPRRASFRLIVPLAVRTSDSSTLIEMVLQATRNLYQIWLKQRILNPSELGGWRKGGILALDLLSHEIHPLEICAPSPARIALSTLEDQLNQRFGRTTAQIGATPKSQRSRPQGNWRGRSEFCSPRYTSTWGELLVIDLDRVYQPSLQRALR